MRMWTRSGLSASLDAPATFACSGARPGTNPGSRVYGSWKTKWQTQYTRAAAVPAAGKVSTQAVRMVRATPQRTAENRLVAPAPMIAEVMVWVVEIGAWKTKAVV